jgi:hypothetical protein
VYFVKQLQVRDTGADDETATRLIPMLREYTVLTLTNARNFPRAKQRQRMSSHATRTNATRRLMSL